jgi:hypothetical protein
MSQKKHPECPVAIPQNCPEFRNGRVCALVRGDKRCLRNFSATRRERIDVIGLGSSHTAPVSSPTRNIDAARMKKGRHHHWVYYDKG